MRKWIILFLLFLLNILNYADKAIIGVAAGPIMKDLNLTYEQWGLIGSSFYWLYFISTLLGGMLSDRLGPRKVLAYMAIIWMVAQFIPFVASGMALLLISRLILGLGEGPFYPVSVNQLNKWFPQEQRGLATSILNMGGSWGNP
ncbi:MFS transporter [Bacillus sp. JJ722]|uniref:MFS transporter n=1 Tax=Bacillus sp. JJ722 TaxID=3122973 RepID=UPI002FFD9014